MEIAERSKIDLAFLIDAMLAYQKQNRYERKKAREAMQERRKRKEARKQRKERRKGSK